MAKKLVAVTNIKHNGEYIPAGEAIDASKFEKDELKQLHDAGAVKVEGEDDPTAEELAPEQPDEAAKEKNEENLKKDAEEEEKKEEAPKAEAPKAATTTTSSTTPTKATTPTKSTTPSK
jgi:hypothetical protein